MQDGKCCGEWRICVAWVSYLGNSVITFILLGSYSDSRVNNMFIIKWERKWRHQKFYCPFYSIGLFSSKGTKETSTLVKTKQTNQKTPKIVCYN